MRVYMALIGKNSEIHARLVTATVKDVIFKRNDFSSVITVSVMASSSCLKYWVNHNLFTCRRLSTRSLLRVNTSPRGWVLCSELPWRGALHRKRRKQEGRSLPRRGEPRSWRRCLPCRKHSSRKMLNYWHQWKLKGIFWIYIPSW